MSLSQASLVIGGLASTMRAMSLLPNIFTGARCPQRSKMEALKLAIWRRLILSIARIDSSVRSVPIFILNFPFFDGLSLFWMGTL